MRSRHHLPVSLVVGAGCGAVLSTPTPLSSLGVVVYAGLVGTLVDLDHFLLARYNTGSWAALRRALGDPRTALVNQPDLFEAHEVRERQRLGSHLLFGTGLVAATAALSMALALTTAAVLAVHVLSDVAWDATRDRTATEAGQRP